MNEVDKLLDQFRRSFEKECWAGPAVLEVLEGVTHDMAAKRPIANAHTIWELVLHMATWMDVGRWRIEGNEHVPTDEENFPPVTETTKDKWEEAVTVLKTAHAKLIKTVEGMSEEQLQEQIPAGGGLTHLVRLHGVIQHNMYHAGQINLLKKARGWEYKPEE